MLKICFYEIKQGSIEFSKTDFHGHNTKLLMSTRDIINF